MFDIFTKYLKINKIFSIFLKISWKFLIISQIFKIFKFYLKLFKIFEIFKKLFMQILYKIFKSLRWVIFCWMSPPRTEILEAPLQVSKY